MKNCFVLLFFLIIVNHVYSQSCLIQGIEFNTQYSIDSFLINYPNCTEIEGDVIISGNGINNLNGLSQITQIGGNLEILDNPDLSSLLELISLEAIGGTLLISGNESLINLSGLDSLKTIGNNLFLYFNRLSNLSGLGSISCIQGFLSIIGNDSLNNLQGLNNLKYINKELTVISNTELINMTGLDSLEYIGGGLLIAHNPMLKSLIGLNSLTYIGNSLSIWFNPELKNLIGLGSLSHSGVVSIKNNSSLKSLDGLEMLKEIRSSLLIQSNDSLEDLNGLLSVKSIGGSLKIEDNIMLKSLSGIDNIKSYTIDDLYIENNDSLSSCAVKSICDYLVAPGGTVSIYGNSPGCNSQSEVHSDCSSYGAELEINIFLQGAYIGNKMMGVNLVPIVSDHQPYDTLPWNYQGNESLDSVPENMVDWVLIELRV